MNLKTGLVTVLVAAVVAAIVTGASTLSVLWRTAPDMVNAPGQALQEKQVVDIVHNYLTKNPEILVEMTTELDKRQAADQAEKQQKTISDNADAMFRSPLAFVAGNPDGDVSVVEFFDYNCGYCRRALPDVVKLVDNDGKVRVVLKELPIFGEDSEAAAKAALAARQAGQIFRDASEAVHRARQGRQGEGAAYRRGARARYRQAREGHGGSRGARSRSTRPRSWPRSSGCKARRSISSATA